MLGLCQLRQLAVGVGARKSATKSAIVKSVSWPTAEINNRISLLKIALATISSLKAHNSSIEPPRPTISTSISPISFAVRIACTIEEPLTPLVQVPEIQ